MSASKVLDLAVAQGLLDAKVIAELRKQIADSRFVVTPEAIAKVLVDHGHLTPFQARKLVSAALGDASEPEPLPKPPAPVAAKPAPPSPPRPAAPRKDIPDDLTLADDEGNSEPPPAPVPPPAEEIIDLEPVQPTPSPKPQPTSRPQRPSQPAGAKRESPSRPAAAPAKAEEIVDLEPVPPTPRRRPPAPSRPAVVTPVPAAEDLVPLTPLTPVAPARAPLAGQAATTALAPAPAPAAPVVKPIDDLFGDPMAAQADPLANSALLGAAPPAAEAKKKKGRTNVWDSPLLLLGGGGLGVILIAFFLLLYSLTRGSAAELFAKAEEEYTAGSYAGAIKYYENYLEKYPDGPESSLGRVRVAMAQLHQVSDGGSSARQSLQIAKDILPKIETEEKFGEARIELSGILPDIADGFATEASRAPTTEKKEELVKLANEAMELVNNPSYIPASLRKDREARIAGILDTLQVAQRSIDQDKELLKAIEKIAAAGKQGDAAAAYKVRSDLLKVYPGLETHPDLVAAVLAVGDRERQLVQVSQPKTAALTDDPTPAGVQVILADHAGPAGTGTPGRPVFVLADGSVYALDSLTGRLLWRRYVGYQTRTYPAALVHAGGVDALIVDGRDHQLLRLEGLTGTLVWRQPIGEPFGAPVVSDERIYVTTRKGRLLEITATSGEIAQQAQLPQGATMPLATSTRQKKLLQLGEHSTLFVLNGDTLEGLETYYLGHKTGAIFVPPVAVLDHVLVPESPGDDYTLIHVLGTDEKSKRLAAIGQPFRLRGRVLTPLAVSKRRVAALTDLGQVAVYEVDSSNKQQPVRQVGGLEAGEKPAVMAWCALDDNRLWTAGKRCTLLEVQASLQQIGRKWTLHQDDAFIGPLQVQDGLLIHLRRRSGGPGLVVEGCSGADGQTQWTTQIAVPIVALEVNEGRKAVDCLAASGRLFALTGEQLKGGIVDAPTFTPPPGSGLAILPTASLSADGQTLVWTEARAGGRVFEYNVSAGGTPVATELPAGALATEAAQVWRGKLLTPLASGGLALLDSKTGSQTVQPFVPPLAPDMLPRWTRPAILPDESSCLISDGRRSVYRIALRDQPQPHLALAVEAPTEPPIVSPLVAAGGSIYGCKRGEAADTIVAFDPQALPNAKELPLTGHVQSGPFALGGLVILASEPDGLLCIESGPKIRWQKPLAHGPLAGAPLALADGDVLLIHQGGGVSRISADTGEELAAIDVAQPLGAAARVLGQHVFLSGSDGVVHRATVPQRP
jgi:hypothetical protein